MILELVLFFLQHCCTVYGPLLPKQKLLLKDPSDFGGDDYVNQTQISCLEKPEIKRKINIIIQHRTN